MNKEEPTPPGRDGGPAFDPLPAPRRSDASGRAPLLIHIGYPKTASSWLQTFLFDHEASPFCAPWGRRATRALDAFVFVNSFRFRAAEARRVFEPSRCEAADRGLVPVLSEEILSCHYVGGSYLDAGRTADRLAATFPEARILLCIREQKSMLLSTYRELVKSGSDLTLREYLGRPRVLAGAGRLPLFEFLQYEALMQYYHQLFGPENVLVLPYEMLRSETDAFYRRILSFTGAADDTGVPAEASVNVGKGAAVVSLRRWLNAVWPSPPFRCVRDAERERFKNRLCRVARKGIPERLNARIERRMEQEVAEHVGSYYCESNRQVSRLIGIELDRYGYPT